MTQSGVWGHATHEELETPRKKGRGGPWKNSPLTRRYYIVAVPERVS
jgi:hypothetical protein